MGGLDLKLAPTKPDISGEGKALYHKRVFIYLKKYDRYPFMFGTTQLLESDPSQAGTIVPALYKFVNLANTMLHNNGEGLEDWGNSRWEDFAITLQW